MTAVHCRTSLCIKQRAVKIFVMSTRRNDIYFPSACIVGRAIEYVPSRLIDVFPRRRLGALYRSFLLALASIFAAFQPVLLSLFSPSLPPLLCASFVDGSSLSSGVAVASGRRGATAKRCHPCESPAAPARRHHQRYLLRSRSA